MGYRRSMVAGFVLTKVPVEGPITNSDSIVVTIFFNVEMIACSRLLSFSNSSTSTVILQRYCWYSSSLAISRICDKRDG